jgi:hypothetical protein
MYPNIGEFIKKEQKWHLIEQIGIMEEIFPKI